MKKSTFLLLFLFIPILAFGAINTNNNSQLILQTFIDASNSWQNAIIPTAKKLFWGFVLIDVVITFGFLAVKQAEIMEIFGELLRKILWIGFFLFLFQTADLLSKIPESFSQIANNAAGKDIMPDTILESAMSMVLSIWEGVDWDIGEALVIVFTGIICLIAFGLMAAQLFVTLVKIQALIAGAYLVFAFGGLSYTRSMAINPLKAIFAAGMELMFIKLFLVLTLSTVTSLENGVAGGDDSMGAYVTIIVISILLVSVVSMIPSLVSSLMSGTLGGSSTSGLAVAAGVAAGAVAGGVASAKHGTGMASAVKAAKQQAANGTGTMMGNLGRAMGNDMMDTIKGKNARNTTSAASRAADAMKAQTQAGGGGSRSSGGDGEISKGASGDVNSASKNSPQSDTKSFSDKMKVGSSTVTTTKDGITESETTDKHL